MDGERTVEVGGRELSAYDGVDKSKNNAIPSHVKNKQYNSFVVRALHYCTRRAYLLPRSSI